MGLKKGMLKNTNSIIPLAPTQKLEQGVFLFGPLNYHISPKRGNLFIDQRQNQELIKKSVNNP